MDFIQRQITHWATTSYLLNLYQITVMFNYEIQYFQPLESVLLLRQHWGMQSVQTDLVFDILFLSSHPE